MNERIVKGGHVIMPSGEKVLINEHDDKFYNMEKTSGKVLPNGVLGNNYDFARGLMSMSFENSTVPMLNPDIPIMASSYNRALSKNNLYKLDKDDNTVIDIIYRNLNENDKRCTIIYADKNNIIHVKELKSITQFSDGVAVRNEINTKNHIYKTTSFSDDGYLMLGQNVLCMWGVTLDVLEDAQLISKKFAERSKTMSYNTASLKINPDNVIFTSGFPYIGKKCKTAVAVAVNAEKNYTNILSPKVHYNRDKIYYNPSAGYICEDISISYRNSSIFINKDINELIEKDREYNRRIYEKLMEIKNDYSTDPKLSKSINIDIEQFMDKYNRIFIQNVKIRHYENELEDNKVFLSFTFTKVETATGQKYSGSFGNKGTVSNIVDFICKDEFGREIETKHAGAGVYPRSTMSPFYEMGLDFLAFRMLKEMEAINMPIEKRKKMLLQFVGHVCRSNLEKYVQIMEENSDDVLMEGLFKATHIQTYLHTYDYELNPITFSELVDLVMSTNPEKFKTVQDLYLDLFDKDGNKIGRGVVGHMYLRRAKQTAVKKQSVRTKGRVGSDGLNKKTTLEGVYNDNPVKAAETELLAFSSVFEDPTDLSLMLDTGVAMEAARALYRALGLELIV